MSRTRPYDAALIRFREYLVGARVGGQDRTRLLGMFREAYELGLTEGANAANDAVAVATQAMARTIDLMAAQMDSMQGKP